MARLGETLGFADNPFYKAFDGNRSAIVSGFAGIGADPLNPASGFSQGFANGMQADTLAATQKKAEAERVAQINQTAQFLRAKGAEDLAAAVEGGMTTGSDAFNQWYQQANAPVEQVKPMEVNGQLVNPMTGQVIGDYRDPNAGQPAAPSGYQWTRDGTQTYIPGGPADPAMAANKPPTEGQRRLEMLSNVIEPEMQRVETNWAELSSGANQAANTEIPIIGGRPGRALTSPGYQQATEALGTIAQSYLYSVSGAAAPVEEVRKLVDSVTPKPFESQASINDKLLRVKEMAAAVKRAAGGAVAQPQQAPGGATSSGLQWSIEP